MAGLGANLGRLVGKAFASPDPHVERAKRAFDQEVENDLVGVIRARMQNEALEEAKDPSHTSQRDFEKLLKLTGQIEGSRLNPVNFAGGGIITNLGKKVSRGVQLTRSPLETAEEFSKRVSKTEKLVSRILKSEKRAVPEDDIGSILNRVVENNKRIGKEVPEQVSQKLINKLVFNQLKSQHRADTRRLMGELVSGSSPVDRLGRPMIKQKLMVDDVRPLGQNPFAEHGVHNVTLTRMYMDKLNHIIKTGKAKSPEDAVRVLEQSSAKNLKELGRKEKQLDVLTNKLNKIASRGSKAAQEGRLTVELENEYARTSEQIDKLVTNLNALRQETLSTGPSAQGQVRAAAELLKRTK